jgi:nucleoside-diphosphate-sugar epimerase
MHNVLITGANSFVGTNFTKNTQNKVVAAFCLVRNKASDINFENIDVVLHLAAIVHKKNAPESIYYKVNTDLTMEVARLAKAAGVKQFIFMSTMNVYGPYSKQQSAWKENSECFPDNDYGKSKYEAEIKLRNLEDSNFTVSIVRPPLVYGAGVPANMLSIIKLVEKIPILPFKAVGNKRYFVSVENLIAYLDQIIKLRASGIFIAADEKPLSTTELVRLISMYLNRRVFLFGIPRFIIKFGIFLVPRFFEKLYGSFDIDNTRTQNILKMKAPFSSEEGVKKMVIHYLEMKKSKQK